MRDFLFLCAPHVMNDIIAADAEISSQGVQEQNLNFEKILQDNVAVISIFGPLFNRKTKATEYLGGRTYSEIIDLVVRHTLDSSITEIVFEVDTLGGEASGVEECAAIISSCQKVKKITTLISGYCFSGGVWLASAASRVLISSASTAMGGVGLIAFRDRHLEKTEVITTGEFKNTFAEANQKYFSAIMNKLLTIFLTDLKRNRRLSEAQIEEIKSGRIFFGDDIITVGLADGFYSPFSWHSVLEIKEIKEDFNDQ